MKTLDQSAPYVGLPNLEGPALIAVQDGQEIEKMNREQEKYVTNKITAIISLNAKGTTHLALHEFNKMGDDGKFLVAAKGRVVSAVLSKNKNGYTEISILGEVGAMMKEAEELQELL
jgi:hypothetical protein